MTIDCRPICEVYHEIIKRSVFFRSCVSPLNDIVKCLEIDDFKKKQKYSIFKGSEYIGTIVNVIPEYVAYDLYLGRTKLMTSECYNEIAEVVKNKFLKLVYKKLFIVVRNKEGIKTHSISFEDTLVKDNLYLLRIERPGEDIPFIWKVSSEPLEIILTKKNYGNITIYDIRKSLMLVGDFNCDLVKKYLNLA